MRAARRRTTAARVTERVRRTHVRVRNDLEPMTAAAGRRWQHCTGAGTVHRVGATSRRIGDEPRRTRVAQAQRLRVVVGGSQLVDGRWRRGGQWCRSAGVVSGVALLLGAAFALAARCDGEKVAVGLVEDGRRLDAVGRRRVAGRR